MATRRASGRGMQADAAEPVARSAGAVLHTAENAVYVVAGVALVGAALLTLVNVGYHLVADLDDGVKVAVTDALDGLLLVFILLELLAGVRATMTERKLVAEPFLVVGIIAAIKEIVVAALAAKEARSSTGPTFDNVVTEIAVLSVLVLLLAASAFLVRRKEREPAEE